MFKKDPGTYEDIVPFELPPSYRGQAVKYSYKLKIGMQRVGAPVKMLHLPLRLMMWQGSPAVQLFTFVTNCSLSFRCADL